MKKTVILGLAFLCCAAALFADDAKVMPKMVGRVYAAPTYSFAMGAYDTDGNYEAYGDNSSVKLFNMGFALEYGVTDWLTAAVQWVPGWTPWSDIGAAMPAELRAAPGEINTNGFADIFAGAKIQLAGEAAPIQTSRFRVAVAPGVIIPLPAPDFEDGMKNIAAGKDATLNSMDKHVFAAGARLYFDFVINKNFFINLYNESIFYPLNQDLQKDGPTFDIVKAAAGGSLNNVEGEVNYKFRLTFEVEPVLTVPIAEGIDFTAGVPVNFRYVPAPEYSFSGGAQAQYDAISANLNHDPQLSLAINPNVSVFFKESLLPIELKFQYGIPLYGQNTMARHNATLQIKAYFALGGAAR